MGAANAARCYYNNRGFLLEFCKANLYMARRSKAASTKKWVPSRWLSLTTCSVCAMYGPRTNSLGALGLFLGTNFEGSGGDGVVLWT